MDYDQIIKDKEDIIEFIKKPHNAVDNEVSLELSRLSVLVFETIDKAITYCEKNDSEL